MQNLRKALCRCDRQVAPYCGVCVIETTVNVVINLLLYHITAHIVVMSRYNAHY